MINRIKQLCAVLGEAWSNRDRLGDGAKSRRELEFLPAALEVLERPPSPAGRLLGWSLMALFSIAVAWSFIGEVDIVAVAEGKIIPGGRVKQIQPLEKGVVKTIYVIEGQSVAAGDPLIELDQALTSADQDRLTNELRFAKLSLTRQRGFEELFRKTNLNNFKHSTDVPLPGGELLTLLQQQSQKNLLWQQWQDYQAQLGTLTSQWEIRISERQASMAVVEKLERTLPLVTKRANALRGLLEKSLASETQYFELEQERIEKQQDLAAEKSRTQQLSAAIAEAEYRISSLKASSLHQALEQVEELERQVHSITQELSKAQDLNERQILYAPVDGRVQQLVVHTVGGVVTEAQPLMLIVPNENHLEVEATLDNKDIGFVYAGQKAEVKVHTFPFTKYGVVDAEVLNITADAVEDEQRGLVYKLRLKMNRSQLLVNGKMVNLIPGMAVSTEVSTGKRRLIEFVLTPLLRYKQESARER